jgi:hypothetical protein
MKKVLVLIPTMESKHLATWYRPYDIVEWVGDMKYCVRQPGQKTSSALPCESSEEVAHTRGVVCNVEPATTEPTLCQSFHGGRPKPDQTTSQLVQWNTAVFSEEPGGKDLVEHYIKSNCMSHAPNTFHLTVKCLLTSP